MKPVSTDQKTATYNILVASRSFGPNSPDAVKALEDFNCRLVPNKWGRKPTEEELFEVVEDVDAIISGTEPITRRVLDAAPRLKVISKHGVGIENIDVEYARKRGVLVCIAANAITASVADMTLALMLTLCRHLVHSHQDVTNGGWRRFVGTEMSGKTLGIIGLGQIGKAVCVRAKGFDMKLLANDVRQDRTFAQEWGVNYVPMERLLEESDFVSLHTNVTPLTKKMVDRQFLKKMKESAFLINASRGELVDEQALADALKSGSIAGAASDVFEEEPPANGHPLLQMDNFLATAHLAGQTREGLQRMGEITAENLLRVLQNREPLYQV